MTEVSDPWSVPVVGAGWSGIPYSFAGNDPVGALDPLGLSPMSADELHAYTEARKSPLEKARGAVWNWVGETGST